MFLFGLSYHREKNYATAVEHFEKAIEVEPSFYQTWHFLGWARYYLGEPDLARAAFEEFLKHEPGEPDSTYALGLIALEADELDRAETLFRASYEGFVAEKGDRDPRSVAKARAKLGEVYDLTGRTAEAKAELEAAVKLFPDHYEAWYKLSRVLTKLGEADAAKQAHQSYLQSKERVRPGTSFPE